MPLKNTFNAKSRILVIVSLTLFSLSFIDSYVSNILCGLGYITLALSGTYEYIPYEAIENRKEYWIAFTAALEAFCIFILLLVAPIMFSLANTSKFTFCLTMIPILIYGYILLELYSRYIPKLIRMMIQAYRLKTRQASSGSSRAESPCTFPHIPRLP